MNSEWMVREEEELNSEDEIYWCFHRSEGAGAFDEGLITPQARGLAENKLHFSAQTGGNMQMVARDLWQHIVAQNRMWPVCLSLSFTQ